MLSRPVHFMITSAATKLPACYVAGPPYRPESRPKMRPIAIVARPGHEIGLELHDAILWLRHANINVHNPTIAQAFALIWVDDENVPTSLETLSTAGFQATALTETDLPH
jgi:hypothetical protein